MRKVITMLGLGLVGFSVMLSSAFGQANCMPETNYTEVGLFPENIPTATLGVPYNEKLDAALPRDTTSPPPIQITLDFCSYRIDSTQPNLADLGLSFDCNEPGCEYTVDHTIPLNFGCVVISGTPTQLFDDSIKVFISAEVGNYDDQTQVCTVVDSTTFDTITLKVAFKIQMNTNIDETNSLNASIFPNPTVGDASLNFNLNQAEVVKVRVLDIQGKEVAVALNQQLFAGPHTISLPTAALDEGMYLIHVESESGRSHVEKLIIRK